MASRERPPCYECQAFRFGYCFRCRKDFCKQCVRTHDCVQMEAPPEDPPPEDPKREEVVKFVRKKAPPPDPKKDNWGPNPLHEQKYEKYWRNLK